MLPNDTFVERVKQIVSQRSMHDAFRERVVYGFHGNSRYAIEQSRRRGFQREGLDGDWLGGGFYFWQDAPQRALSWAHTICRSTSASAGVPAMREPAVILARLQMTEKWIDLLEESEWFGVLRSAAGVLERLDRLPAQSGKVAASDLHRMDYAIIEMAINELRLYGVEVDAMRSAFIEGAGIAPSSAIFDKAHVQITVRNPGIIRAHEFIDLDEWDMRDRDWANPRPPAPPRESP